MPQEKKNNENKAVITTGQSEQDSIIEDIKKELLYVCHGMDENKLRFGFQKKGQIIVIYNGNKDTFPTGTRAQAIPKAIRKKFRLDPDSDWIAGWKGRLAKFRERFFSEHPMYKPFMTLFHWYIDYSQKEEQVCIYCESEGHIVPMNINSTFDVVFTSIDRHWEGALTKEDAIKNYIIYREPSYKNIDFQIEMDPLQAGIDGHWTPLYLESLANLSKLYDTAVYSKRRDKFMEHIRENLPAQFSQCELLPKKKTRLTIKFIPKPEYPILHFAESIILSPNMSDEAWKVSFEKICENYLSEGILNTRSVVLEKMILQNMEDIKEKCQKGGYYDLKPTTRKGLVLSPLLEDKSFFGNIRLGKSTREGIYPFSVCGCEFEYDMSVNQLYRIKCTVKMRSAIKQLKQLEKQRQIFVDKFEQYTPCSFKVKITQKNDIPSGLSISFKKDGFTWEKTITVNKTLREVRTICRTFSEEWKIYDAEEKAKKKQELRKIKANPFYGDLLVAKIVHTVDTFDWPPSISSLLSELKFDDLARDYTRDALNEKVDQLCQGKVLTTTRRYSTKYSIHYDAYSLASPEMKLLSDPTPSHYGKDKKYSEYTDIDWKYFLHDFDPQKEQSALIWKRQTALWDHTSVLFLCEDDVCRYYDAAPDQIKAFVKARYDISKDRSYRRALKPFVTGGKK